MHDAPPLPWTRWVIIVGSSSNGKVTHRWVIVPMLSVTEVTEGWVIVSQLFQFVQQSMVFGLLKVTSGCVTFHDLSVTKVTGLLTHLVQWLTLSGVVGVRHAIGKCIIPMGFQMGHPTPPLLPSLCPSFYTQIILLEQFSSTLMHELLQIPIPFITILCTLILTPQGAPLCIVQTPVDIELYRPIRLWLKYYSLEPRECRTS